MTAPTDGQTGGESVIDALVLPQAARRDPHRPYPTRWFVGIAVPLAGLAAVGIYLAKTTHNITLGVGGLLPLANLVVVAIAWAVAPIWGRRVLTLELWVLLQSVFIVVPPLVGVAFNLAVAAGFVWWFVLRRGPGARRRHAIFRLRPITPALARRLPLVAVPLAGLVATSLVVVPRVIPFPPTRTNPLDTYLRQPYAVVALLVLVSIVAPLLEEFLFRGWIQRSLENRLRATQAIGLTALLFAVAHGELFGLPIRFVFGLVAGYAAWSTRSIWPGVLLHGTYNAALIGLGSATPGVDEKVLTRWAHTPSIFWPVVAAFVTSALLVVAALRALARAAPNGRRIARSANGHS